MFLGDGEEEKIRRSLHKLKEEGFLNRYHAFIHLSSFMSIHIVFLC